MKKSDIKQLPGYFDRYINLVADIELSEAINKSIKQLDDLDRDLLSKLDGKKYAPDKFTVKGILQHTIDFERVLAYRALLFARREGSIPQAVDENSLGVTMNADRRAFDDLIDELKIARQSTGALFASFDDEMLRCIGINWKYEISVLAMGFAIVGHQIHHLNIIEERYYSLI